VTSSEGFLVCSSFSPGLKAVSLALACRPTKTEMLSRMSVRPKCWPRLVTLALALVSAWIFWPRAREFGIRPCLTSLTKRFSFYMTHDPWAPMESFFQADTHYPYIQPGSTGRTYGPYIRAVFTVSAYRPFPRLTSLVFCPITIKSLQNSEENRIHWVAARKWWTM